MIMKEEKKQWCKARQQANQSGITRTRRKNKQGEYVCYLNKKTMKAYLWKVCGDEYDTAHNG